MKVHHIIKVWCRNLKAVAFSENGANFTVRMNGNKLLMIKYNIGLKS